MQRTVEKGRLAAFFDETDNLCSLRLRPGFSNLATQGFQIHRSCQRGRLPAGTDRLSQARTGCLLQMFDLEKAPGIRIFSGGMRPSKPLKKVSPPPKRLFREESSPFGGGLRGACHVRHAPLLFNKKGRPDFSGPQGRVLNYCAAASSMASSTVRSMYSPSGMEVWSS